MKLAWSLYWRSIVLQAIFNVLTTLLLRNTGIVEDTEMTPWIAPIQYLSLAALLLIVQLIKKRSLVWYVFGVRLNWTDAFWRRWTFTLIGFCIFVALLRTGFAQFASFNTWNKFQIYSPPIVFIALAILFPSAYRKYSANNM